MSSIGLQLTLFNRFSLYAPDGTPRTVTAARRRALIAFLACQPDAQASRERLATLLWGDSPDAQARQSLRQALLILRRELGPERDLLLADRNCVSLDLERIEIDRRRFDRLALSDDPSSLLSAASFGAEAFLADLALDVPGFEEWLRAERARCLDRLSGALERLATHLLKEGRTQDAVPVLDRLSGLAAERPELARTTEDLRALAGRTALPPAGSPTAAPDQPPDLGLAPDGHPIDRGSGPPAPSPSPRAARRWLVPALAAGNLVLLGLLFAGRWVDRAAIWPFTGADDTFICASGATRGATRFGAQGWMHAKPGATCHFVGYLVPDKGLVPDELRVTRPPQLGQASIAPDRSIVYVAGDRPGTDVFAVEGGGAHAGETLSFRLTFTVAIRP